MLGPPNNIRHPNLARLTFVFAAKAAAATAVTGCAFPVHLNPLESGVEHDIAKLWDAPHAPVVGEGTLAGSSIFRLEVDAESAPVVDRVKIFLLKKVGETRKSLLIKGGLAGLGPAECVHHEESVPVKRLSARLEVANEGRPLMKAEVAEV